MQESAREAIGMADSIVALQRDYRERLQKARISANLLAAVDYLFQQPAVSIPKLREHLGVSYPAAKANVELLIREKILTEVAGSDNPRLFFARDIISIISGKTNA
jgi:DNA-binding MarR family transcriptional regulator